MHIDTRKRQERSIYRLAFLCIVSGGDGGSRTPVQNKLTERVYTFSSLFNLAGYSHEEQSD